MNNKEIKKIYEVIADKSLEFWCQIKIEELGAPIIQEYWYDDGSFWDEYYVVWFWDELISESWDWECSIEFIKDYLDNPSMLDKEEEVNSIDIIWHPIHYWYAVDWMEKNIKWPVVMLWCWCSGLDTVEVKVLELMNLWKDKTKPIENQSGECQKFLFDLIK